MSRFYASIRGQRGEATRCGYNGITGHIRGWHVGVRVEGFAGDDGEDCFRVYATGGSAGRTYDRCIGIVRRSETTDSAGTTRTVVFEPAERTK